MAPESVRPTRWRSTLEGLSLVAMTLASVVMIWTVIENRGGRSQPGRPPLPVPREPLSLAGAQTKGDERARLVVVEFTDFQCPFCARFARETLKEIDREYVNSGKVRLALRHFPLGIHPGAQLAAEAALCAGRQDKFWQMHDKLFQNPSIIDEPSIARYAESIGFDQSKFESCLHGHQMAAQVEADLAIARKLGVGGTPAFLIGQLLPDGQVKGLEWVGGSQPYQEFKKALDRSVRRVSS